MRESMMLGIHLGTAAVTVTAVEPWQGAVASESRPVDVHAPRPGWVEADPRQWWTIVCSLIPRVVKAARVTAAEIAAVAVTGTTPTVVPVDRYGKALRKVILPGDTRAVDETTALVAQLADVDTLALTGSPPDRQWVAPVLAWLATHEPEAWRQAVAVVGGYDWLAGILGAEPHVETNWARASGMYTLEGEPAAPVVQAAAVSEERLRTPRAPGTRVGTVNAAAASDTGLLSGTPVVVGGADHVLTAYATGLIEPGDWAIALDDVGVLAAVSAEPVVRQGLRLDAHAVTGRWLPTGRLAPCASLLDWVGRLTGADDLAALEKEAEQRAPATALCLPELGSFVGLGTDVDDAGMYRACLEATAYAFRQHTELLDGAGVRLGLGRVTGKGARSTLWTRVLADVLGRQLYPMADGPGPALGAAATAGVGVGVFADWAEGAGVVRLGSPVEPTPTAETAYEEGYQMYVDLHERLREPARRLASRSRR